MQEKAARGESGERGIWGRRCSISAAAASKPRGHVISFGVAIYSAIAVFAEPHRLGALCPFCALGGAENYLLFLTVSRLPR